MTIHFFTKGDKNAGSSRQRAFFVAEELNKKNIKAIVHQPPLVLTSEAPWPKKSKLIFQYLKIFTQIKKTDIIFLQRAIYNKYFFILIVLHKLIFRRKMIFDFDDAIYQHSFLKTKILTKLADVIIVGSHSLRDWAKQYNKNVYIVPTCVKFEKYKKFSKEYSRNTEKIVIGWIGGAKDQFENLRLLKEPFRKIITDNLSAKFFLVGALKYQPVYNLFSSIKGLEVEFVDSLNWSDSIVVPSCIQQFDIGVMPLVNNEWNQGKCAFKAIEYMACGIPTIVSPVGENNYLIQDGVNGFLASSSEEYAVKLKKLIQSPELRKKLGQAGQKTIEENYSYKVNVSKLIKIFNSL